MSNQPPYGQGSWQQPPAGPPPGQGPGGPPGPPPGPPGPGGPPPPGGGYPPPGGPGGPPGPPPPGGPGGPPPPGGPGGPGGPPEFGPGPGGPPGRSKTPLILGIVGAVVVLVGAGLLLYFLVFSDDDDAAGDYCTLLEDNRDTFTDFATGNFGADEVEGIVDTIHEIRESAPEEVADEWAQLDDPIQDFQAAMDDAGVTWQDLEGFANEAELREQEPELADAFVAMQQAIGPGQIDLSAINQTLRDHADEVCGFDLTEEPSSEESPS